MSALVGVVALAVLVGFAIHVGRRTAAANRRINRDIARLRAVPKGGQR